MSLATSRDKNIVIDYRYSHRKNDELLSWLQSSLRLKVDVIVVARGDQSIGPFSRTRPKRFLSLWWALGGDPVEAGLVESLASPGGNVTGISNLGPELGGKRLELLKEAVTKLVSVVFSTWNPASPARHVRCRASEAKTGANGLGLTLQTWDVRAADGFEKVFAALSKERNRMDSMCSPAR